MALDMADGKASVYWRVMGNKRTPKPEGPETQTLEFRLLQGTLDAEHVWKWASIIERGEQRVSQNHFFIVSLRYC
jgi:hypothetical protein